MAAKRSADEETITTDDLPCTVKLIRAESYNYKGRKYVKGVEVAVTRPIAEYLAEQVISRKDRDGEAVEKPVFKVTGIDDDEDDEDAAPTRKTNRAKPSRRKLT